MDSCNLGIINQSDAYEQLWPSLHRHKSLHNVTTGWQCLWDATSCKEHLTYRDIKMWEMGILVSYYHFHYFHLQVRKMRNRESNNFCIKESDRRKEDKDIMEHFLQILQLVDKQTRQRA